VAPKAGASSTAPIHSQFSITKLLDAATPKLYEACATAKHIKEVTIELVSAKGGSSYLQIKLEDVEITSVADSSDPAGPLQFPLESFSLAYGVIPAPTARVTDASSVRRVRPAGRTTPGCSPPNYGPACPRKRREVMGSSFVGWIRCKQQLHGPAKRLRLGNMT
jgi:hypothetical protein